MSSSSSSGLLDSVAGGEEEETRSNSRGWEEEWRGGGGGHASWWRDAVPEAFMLRESESKSERARERVETTNSVCVSVSSLNFSRRSQRHKMTFVVVGNTTGPSG